LIGTCDISAAAEDTFTCALSRAYDCYPDDGCKERSIAEMGLPRFVRINLKDKTITSLDKVIPNNSKISSIERIDDLVVMHGTELRGWSMAVSERSRNITLSASGDGDSFTVFGICMDK
jgi:hypothetical protein